MACLFYDGGMMFLEINKYYMDSKCLPKLLVIEFKKLDIILKLWYILTIYSVKSCVLIDLSGENAFLWLWRLCSRRE